MDNELLCLIDMFSSTAEVIYPDTSKENIPLLGAIKYLYETCKQENIYTLHLLGNKQYLEGLIAEHPPVEYGCGKVEIKVN